MLDSPFVPGTHIIISSQVVDVEMTKHIGFVNLGTSKWVSPFSPKHFTPKLAQKPKPCGHPDSDYTELRPLAKNILLAVSSG